MWLLIKSGFYIRIYQNITREKVHNARFKSKTDVLLLILLKFKEVRLLFKGGLYLSAAFDTDFRIINFFWNMHRIPI